MDVVSFLTETISRQRIILYYKFKQISLQQCWLSSQEVTIASKNRPRLFHPSIG